MDSLGSGNAVFDYITEGVHAGPHWSDQVYKMLPDPSADLGCAKPPSFLAA
ncbi:hypothetical protein [Nocardia sp. NPDC046763]|uniref:hypothetical protein n=1 Tax=Nocardia sp. NPDC046763 TaxID=3155256 RepID=UPI0033D60A68